MLLPVFAGAQPYTHQDTLRGSNGRHRSWWDVQRYDLSISIDTATKTISGTNTITFKVVSTPTDTMQIDLQDSMRLKPEMFHKLTMPYLREGSVYWILDNHKKWKIGKTYSIELAFEGKPRTAKNAPWDGGFIWAKDSLGNPWIAVACQGLGASSWWPCKDYQGDEPDSGTSFRIFNEFKNNDVSNGTLHESPDTLDRENPVTGQITRYIYRQNHWLVRNPINTYSTTFYIGDYAHWQDTFQGEKGVLSLDFYPLKYNEAKARKQWAVVKDMLRCYEYWLGPYPFYEDGYKLVEAPYLGMEHQGAIAYGNGYQMGYKGYSLGSGVGRLFDYIVIHESGHEWFGNNITAQDIADNWLHEGFTTYVESLYAQWITNREKAFEYTAGEWKHVANDYPVIGDYGVNDDKGSDKYYKGAAVVHMVRMMLNDDERFRQLMRGLNKDFYHKIVTSSEVEAYISRFAGRDLKPFFDQLLRTKNKPVLEWYVAHKELHYRWTNATPGFFAPFRLSYKGGDTIISDNNHSFGDRKFKKRKVNIEPCGWYDISEQHF